MLIDDDGLDIMRDALLPRQTITIDHSPFMADHSLWPVCMYVSMTLYRQWRRLTCGKRGRIRSLLGLGFSYYVFHISSLFHWLGFNRLDIVIKGCTSSFIKQNKETLAFELSAS